MDETVNCINPHRNSAPGTAVPQDQICLENLVVVAMVEICSSITVKWPIMIYPRTVIFCRRCQSLVYNQIIIYGINDTFYTLA